MIRACPAFVLVLGIFGTAVEPSEAGFTLVDLGAITVGQSTGATGINSAGATSGTSTGFSSSSALESTGKAGFQAVNTSGLPGVTSSSAAAVDGAGNVVGTFFDSIDNRYHAFDTVNGVALDLGSFANPQFRGADSWGVGVNAQGEVVGTAQLANGSKVAFRSFSGSVSSITLPGGSQFGQGAGINASGTVVGSYLNSLGISRVFTAAEGATATDLLANDSAQGFGQNTYGAAIDNRGDVTGYGDFNGQSHAFFASCTGKFVDIGVLNGFTSSISIGMNNQGQVVGQLSNGSDSHAFIWDQSAGLFDLNSLLTPAESNLWTLTSATGINDSGQIAGQGYINGALHGFLLTPDSGSSVFGPSITVPTPPSIFLAMGGLTLIGGWRRFTRGRTAGQAGA